MKRPRPTFSKDQHTSVSKKPAYSRSSYSRQQPVSFNIRAFMPLMKSFIKQLKASNGSSDYSLALHMEQYRPLNQQQHQRVFSMFIENQTAQREVASSGKSREENFTGF